ncbi:DUF3303 family protein [Halorarius litoreus]|uniref:DUF3303 family protein n=1 Tax=Halorarius litoreus TaxID=2962676 RepID=UPI0020CE8228|nr:DUF3303 family protein [Halorarius litoreus]
MLFHVALRHSPEHCWARDEHEGKASELVARLDDAEESFGVTVHSSFVAPNEHTFYLLLESESFEGVTGLLGPPLLQDHAADITPVTTFGSAMETLEVE